MVRYQTALRPEKDPGIVLYYVWIGLGINEAETLGLSLVVSHLLNGAESRYLILQVRCDSGKVNLGTLVS